MADCTDSRELLDRSIHEYLLRKNMFETAEIFALEAGIPSTPTVTNDGPNGLLSEWWRLHYDVLFNRSRNIFNYLGASSSTNPGKAPQNRISMQMPTPLHQPQTFRSTTTPPRRQLTILSPPLQRESQMAGVSYSAQAVGPTTMPHSDTGNFLQSDPSTTMPVPGLTKPQRTASPTTMPSPGLPIPPTMMPAPALHNSQQTSSQTIMPTSDTSI